MQIGDQIKVDFIDLDFEGQGVCKIDNFPVFVKGALKGERGLIEITEVKKSFGRGKLIKTYEKSPFRVFPQCPHYEECGGCNLMHLSYSASLEFKRNLAKDTLSRIGKVATTVNPCVASPDQYNYRNKLEFHFGFRDQKIRAGFYDEGSHRLIDIKECNNQPKICLDIIFFLKSIFKIEGVPIYKEKDGRGCIRHVVLRINSKNEIMVVFVTNTNYLKREENIIPALVKKFPEIKSIALSFQPANDNVHFGTDTKILWGSPYLEETITGLKFQISPESFFQINLKQTEKMYQKIVEYANLTGKERVIDAYCGIGTISLFLAKKAKYVYGIEIVKSAVLNANKNMEINKIDNAEFIYGPCEVKIKELIDKEQIDCLVVDPPRKGLDKAFIDAVKEMNIPRIVYVSCNIRTLSRDASYLQEYGYKVIEVTPFDMFPNTTDIESVCLLELKQA